MSKVVTCTPLGMYLHVDSLYPVKYFQSELHTLSPIALLIALL
jgi:hypothetical protein